MQGNVWWLARCLQAMERRASQSPKQPHQPTAPGNPSVFKYVCVCVYIRVFILSFKTIMSSLENGKFVPQKLH